MWLLGPLADLSKQLMETCSTNCFQHEGSRGPLADLSKQLMETVSTNCFQHEESKGKMVQGFREQWWLRQGHKDIRGLGVQRFRDVGVVVAGSIT